MSASTTPAGDAATRDRLIRYFQTEARERCEALIVAFAAEPPPAPAQLARAIDHARVIRGSAAMADLEPISTLAGHLERVIKALHSRRLAWTDTLGTLVRQGAGALLDAINAAAHWSDDHERRATGVAQELSRYDVAARRQDENVIVPIARLFHSDAGPHVLFVPATPQTEFERQLRALAARGAPGAAMRTPPAPAHDLRRGSRRTPTAPRGHELHALLGASVTRMSAAFGASAGEPVPIESLLYSGTAALERARELARVIRARGAENARDLIPELIDLLDLAAAR